MSECKHQGWVVHDIEGANRFLCRECGARFPRHPRKTQEAIDFNRVLDAMTEFRQGMQTFAKSCVQAAMTAEEFKDAIKKMFPPQPIIDHVYSIGNSKPYSIVVGEEPQRTSDPEEVESIFTTPGVSRGELMQIWHESFPDVTEISHHMDPATGDEVITLGFIDGTEQRVEISRTDWLQQALQLYDQGQISYDTLMRDWEPQR